MPIFMTTLIFMIFIIKSLPNITTVLYTVSLSADNGGNTKAPEG